MKTTLIVMLIVASAILVAPNALAADPDNYPSATLLRQASTGTVYALNSDTTKKALNTPYALSPYVDWNTVINVSDATLDSFSTDAGFMPLALGKLFKGETGSTVYFVDSYWTKHPFASADVFNALGYGWDNIIVVPDALLDLNGTGTVLTATDYHPSATLVKTADNPTVYYLLGDSKSAFTSHDIFLLYFQDQEVITISQAELDSYASIAYTPVPPGLLVKSDLYDTVYFVDYDFEKRAFTSGAVFEGLGYQWENVHLLPDLDLGHNLYGAPINSLTR